LDLGTFSGGLVSTSWAEKGYFPWERIPIVMQGFKRYDHNKRVQVVEPSPETV
jgi:hypothetical protein